MKKVMKQLISILLLAAVGGFFGYSLGMAISEREWSIFIVAEVVAFLILWGIVQIIIHEAGHAIFGLLSGYKMVSFRIFSFMWLWQEEDKIAFRRFKLSGTLGQCLMAPPPYREGAFPFRLYLLGGILANLITSILVGVLFTPHSLSASVFVVVGAFLVVTNGIPMGFNDGMSIRVASLSKEQEFLLYMQLEANHQFNLGNTYVDLPSNYFKLVPPVPKRTYFNDYQEFLLLGLLFEQGDLEEYEDLLEELWERQDELVLPYQLELRKEMLMWLCVYDPEDERIFQLWADKKLKESLSQPRIDHKAIEAAYYGFVEDDLEKADEFFAEARMLYDKAPNLASAKLSLERIEWLEELLDEAFQEDGTEIIE